MAALIAVVCVSSGHIVKANADPTVAPKRESIEWCDVWVTGANETNLPRVLLIGDSISRLYYPGVEKALEGKAQCARLATSTCVCDPTYLKELSLLLDNYTFDVIHINNGLHGFGYSEQDYAKSLPGVLQYVKDHAQGAKIIWANTTPVRKVKNLSELDARTERVKERNRIADAAAKAQGIPIDDLFAPVVDHPEYFSKDGVHYNGKGAAVLSHVVADAILKGLAK